MRESGLLIISDMLACNTSRSELCTIPYNGLPAIYKNIVKHFSTMKRLLVEPPPNSYSIVGQTKIEIAYIVLSLLLSNYSVVYNLMNENYFLTALLVC